MDELLCLHPPHPWSARVNKILCHAKDWRLAFMIDSPIRRSSPEDCHGLPGCGLRLSLSLSLLLELQNRIVYGGWTKPRFVLYLEDHDNLQGKIDVLENLGYVVNATEGKTPVFRMTEDFVSLVLSQG